MARSDAVGRRRPPGLAGLRLRDLAPPGASLDASALDELLEAFETALHLPLRCADGVAHALDGALRLDVHLRRHPGLVLADAIEPDDARVRSVGRLPRHLLVGHLLGDAGRVSLRPAGDLDL